MRFSQTSLLLLLGVLVPVLALPQDPVKNPADSTRYQEGFDPNAPTVQSNGAPVTGNLSPQELMALTAQKAGVVHNKITQEAQTVPLDGHVQSQVNKGKITEDAARQEKAKNFIDKTTPGMHGSLNAGGDTVFSTSNPKKKGGASVAFAPHSQLTNDIMDKAKADYKARVQGMTDAEIAAHPEAAKLQMDKAHFAAGGDVKHKSEGHCAEQGCTDAFAASHPGTTMAQFNAIPDKKSASFGKTGNSQTDQPSAACQGKNAGEIGCREFLQASNTVDCEPILIRRSVHFKRAPACAYKPKSAANKAAAAAKAKTPAVNTPASKQGTSAKQSSALSAQKPPGIQKTLGGAVKPAANSKFATPNKAKSQNPLNNKSAPQVKGTTRKAATPAPKAKSVLPAGKPAFKQGPVSKAATGLKKPLTQQKAATPVKAGAQPKAAGPKKPLVQAKTTTSQRLTSQKAAAPKFVAQKAATPQKGAAGLKKPLNQQKAAIPKKAATGPLKAASQKSAAPLKAAKAAPIKAAVPAKAKTAAPVKAAGPIRAAAPVKQQKAAVPFKATAPVKQVAPQKAAVKATTPVKAAAPVRAAAPVKQQKAAAPIKAATPVKQVAPQKAAVKATTPVKAAAPVRAAAPAPVRAAPVPVKAAAPVRAAAPAPVRAAPVPVKAAPAPFKKATTFSPKQKGKRSSGDSRRRSSGDSR